MIVLWKNLFDLDAAHITASAVSATMGLSNVALDTLCDYTRLLKGNQSLTLDCGTVQQADCVAIASHCTITLINKIPVVSKSITTGELYGSNDNFATETKICDISDHGGKVIYGTFTPVSFRYFRIKLNGDKYHDIGKPYIGMKEIMPGQEISQKVSINHHTSKVVSKSGQKYAQRRYQSQQYVITLPDMPTDEFVKVRTLWESVGDWKSFFVAIWEDEMDLMPMIYGSFDMDSGDFPRNQPGGYYPSFEVTVTEGY